MNHPIPLATLRTTAIRRVAVTSQNFRAITGHAGKTRRFLVFETDSGGEVREVDRVDLPPGLSLHDYHGDDHPLFELGLDAIVTQGAGAGFMQRMARQGIQVHATSATDPLAAAIAVFRGEPLPAAAPHHDHHHQGPGQGHHGHRHDPERPPAA